MVEVWTLNYIADAATRRVGVGRFAGSSNYGVPFSFTGVHLCGQTDDGEQPTTVALYPMSRAQAERLWGIAAECAACERDAEDFIVDLFIDGSCDRDFSSNRQLWPRAIVEWNALAKLALPHPTGGPNEE